LVEFLADSGVAMPPSATDRSAIQEWLNAAQSFLIQEGGGLTLLALLDLLDAGHQAAAPVAVVWIEGRLTTLLGQLGQEDSLEPWRVLLVGASQGHWSLYLHNVPTPAMYLEDLPPRSRSQFISRANFIRFSAPLLAITAAAEPRAGLRMALLSLLAKANEPRAALLREIYPEPYPEPLPPAGVHEDAPASPYQEPTTPGQAIWAVSPGGSTAYQWQAWLTEEHLSVGDSDWDHIPDLLEFADQAAFYARYQEEGWRDKRDALWKVRSLRPGDIILANHGRTRILGVGIVQAPGYLFRPDREKHRHTVRVKWDPTRTLTLEKPGPRWLHTIHPVSLEEFQAWFGSTFQMEVELDQQTNLAEAEGVFDASSIEDARERVAAAIVRRRGQQAFREALLKRYHGRCVVTGCDVVAVLEAAHIVPYQGVATNHPENGLLLRADIHTLFDLGLLAITQDLRVAVHPSLFGTSHGELNGRPLLLPPDLVSKPSSGALAEHRAWAGITSES
jgi:hypothetical protein